MDIIRDLDALSAWRQKQTSLGRSVALVPTMGNLHEGHLNLVRAALNRAERPAVLVSIFVNPMQFDDVNDLNRYPRTEQADIEQLSRLGIDAVFLPLQSDLTPQTDDYTVRIDPGALARRWEGATRPGHFMGMATIVIKLFHLTQPQFSVFGQKDFQQLQIVRRMVSDLNLPINIMSVPIARATDGLALSSRNRFLDERNRRVAPELHATLIHAAQQIQQGAPWDVTLNDARHQLTDAGFAVDYFALCHPETLEPLLATGSPVASPAESTPERGILLAAARLGGIRLLDNEPVNLLNPLRTVNIG